MKISAWVNWRYVGAAISLALLAAALLALHHILAEVHPSEVIARFHETPWISVLPALACTAGSYLALTGYDVLALIYIGKPQPYKKAALASFTSYTFSHNIGLSLITGGSIRYRIYSAIGLSAPEIATLTAVCALTFALAVTAILGLALTLEPQVIATADNLSPALNRIAGLLILACVFGYVVVTTILRRPIRFRDWMVQLPALPMTLGQLTIGALDIAFASAALYVLLPSGVDVSFTAFVGIYVAAMTVGVLSHSPGVVGVFEAIILLAIPSANPASLLGSLLVYRCIYYLLPLAFAAGILAWHEMILRRAELIPAAARLRDWAHSVAPQVIGVVVFVSGAILLFSAATPAISDRIATLRHILPLPFVEASHFFSSLVGFILLILSRGLFRRLDGAYHLTLALLGVAIAFSLLKGLDYEVATVLGFVSLLLIASRRSFRRKASMFTQSFSPAWLATTVAVVGASIWLGIFSHKHVEYTHRLWWEFAYLGDAPRFLRASVAVSSATVGFMIFLLLRPAAAGGLGVQLSREGICPILSRATRTDANLALTGDKRFIMSEQSDAFIMFQIKGRSWVAMGDPVGPEASWESLLWQFRELCDRHSGWPVFYQVSSETLPFYLDLGLSLLKIGEEARVDLREFSLEGSARRDLRHADRRAAREGASFEVIPAARIQELLPELKAVSDDWLAGKSTHEKEFSVGAFSEDYVGNFDCAVVRRGEKIVAFANIWAAPCGGELSIDLMRYGADAPYGVMDYLFTRLMIWGREQNYEWFSLGMAPLSGLEAHPLGPVWNRVGAFIFRHGEHFYNFEGLRAYKEKFTPVWRPRYIAIPGGLALPRILLDIAALTSGGVDEIFRK